MDQETKATHHYQTQISQCPFETGYRGFGRQMRNGRLKSGFNPSEEFFDTTVTFAFSLSGPSLSSLTAVLANSTQLAREIEYGGQQVVNHAKTERYPLLYMGKGQIKFSILSFTQCNPVSIIRGNR